MKLNSTGTLVIKRKADLQLSNFLRLERVSFFRRSNNIKHNSSTKPDIIYEMSGLVDNL